MRAKTQLHVTDDTKVEIVLEINVGELKALLVATQDAARWPMPSMRTILRESLDKANTAYFSQYSVEG